METGAPQTEPEKLRLKVVSGNAAGMLIEVEQELVIGREADGHGALASDVEISRRHARIASEAGGEYVIEDLGSTNGTYLNGRRVEAATALQTGDRIELGSSALVVQFSNLQPTPPGSGTIEAPPLDAEPPAEPPPAEPPPAETPAEPALGEPMPEPPPAEPPHTEEQGPPGDAGAPAASPPRVSVRVDVDLEAGRAVVSLDEGSDEVQLAYEDGRWRLS
jgi:pSer/pThr/pTyr-binding forkhead associated (FHA) protein